MRVLRLIHLTYALPLMVFPLLTLAQEGVHFIPKPDQTLLLWTHDRMAGAQPMPLREAYGEPLQMNQFNRRNPPGYQPGKRPKPARPSRNKEKLWHQAKQTVRLEQAAIEPQIFGGTVWLKYPPPFIRTVPNTINEFPNSALGKLFFTDPGVGDFVCSAAAVVSSNNAIILTAGHCCHPGGTGNDADFYVNHLFVPACVGTNCATAGTAPFGRWVGDCLEVDKTSHPDWFNDGNEGRDYCVIRTKKNNGRNLHDVVGALGFKWNQVQPLRYHTSGWPAQGDFDGSRLVLEVASAAELDGSNNPNTIGLGSDMTGGASGGAWIFWTIRKKGHLRLSSSQVGTVSMPINIYSGLKRCLVLISTP
jgi:hypothetical protein